MDLRKLVKVFEYEFYILEKRREERLLFPNLRKIYLFRDFFGFVFRVLKF